MGLFSSEISPKRMMPLCRQLAASYEAGIPIVRSLELAGGQVGDRTLRQVMTRMGDDLKQGHTLAEAAAAQSRYFPPLFVALLASGETGGRLDEMLRDLAQYYEDRLAMRRKIAGLMIYPCLQLAAAWYLGSFALMILRRVLDSIFGSGAAPFRFDTFVEEYLWFQASAHVVFAAVFAGAVMLARLGVLGFATGIISTHVWPFSPVTRKFALSRFFRNLGLMIGSGVNILHAIKSAAATAANPYIERDLLKALPHVRRGETLSRAFSGSRFLNPTAREMLAVGEETGALDTQLRKLSAYLFDEASHAVQMAARALSVLILIAVGLLVGYIVVTFYGQLYGRAFNELGI